MEYSCIIVEDEPLAVEILESHIAQVPFLRPLAAFGNAIDALNFLRSTKVDLIFLDIHLPRLKGLDFLATLKDPPRVIITTAYHEYALKGYEFNVTDYLLKPIEFNRFLTAINKLKASGEASPMPELREPHGERGHMFFNMNKKRIKIYLDEILFIESQKEYIKIFTTSREVVTKLPLGAIDELLSKSDFLRVHRSFIVAKRKIDAFTSTDLELAGRQVPIGRSYKELVHSVLGQMA